MSETPLNLLVQPGSIVRVFDDVAGAYPMHYEGRDPHNWTDELVLRVDTHVVETKQIAECLDGEMLPATHLFPGLNAICTQMDPEHFEVLPQLCLPSAGSVP